MNLSIDGVEFSIRKIRVGEMLPLLPRLATDQANVQRDMVAMCVMVNGSPIGEKLVNEMDWDVYTELSQAVLKQNGFPGEEVEKG